MSNNDETNLHAGAADRQAPQQPKPWELPQRADGLPAFWRPENVEASARANQEYKERQARLDAEPDSVKIARENAKQAKAIAQHAEHVIEIEKEKTRREELKTDKRQPGALLKQAQPNQIHLEVAVPTDETVRLDYLIDPWLPRKQVLGFYGRGGTAKSSFVASLAAGISSWASTLWVSSEEPGDWIKVRHIKTGGLPQTMYVYKGVAVTDKDAAGRATATTFNIYEHLDAAIEAAKVQCAVNAANFTDKNERSLRLVVLDATVALTTWMNGESPNQDAGVKRLIAYLYALAEKHDVTILMIGHVNKGKHDNIADMVAGCGAWITSTRQSFVHLHDQRAEHSYVVITAKFSLTGQFAAEYTTAPVHTLAERADGNHSVLCRVLPGPVITDWKQIRELTDIATGKERDSESKEPKPPSQRQLRINQAVTTVLELLNAGETATRKTVELKLGYEVNTRHWPDIESLLGLVHHVRSEPIAHNGRLYVRQT